MKELRSSWLASKKAITHMHIFKEFIITKYSIILARSFFRSLGQSKGFGFVVNWNVHKIAETPQPVHSEVGT